MIINKDYLNDFLRGGLIKPALELSNGVTLSVQASQMHYSSPRDTNGPYKRVEVGYPSVSPSSDWEKYFDGNFDEDPTDSVYAYVPIEMVVDFINENGGIKKDLEQ